MPTIYSIYTYRYVFVITLLLIGERTGNQASRASIRKFIPDCLLLFGHSKNNTDLIVDLAPIGDNRYMYFIQHEKCEFLLMGNIEL